MEQQVLQILQATLAPNTDTVRNAELSLLGLYANPDFPFALLFIAGHENIDGGQRKAALTTLKNYVLATWSPQIEEHFKGTVYLNDEAKNRIRNQVFALCTTGHGSSSHDASIQSLAAGVASRIASVDFPDAWPDLFPTLLTIINGTSSDDQVLGALRVLSELVDSGFTEEQFFAIARDLVNALQNIATNAERKPLVRALAMSVFRSCFEMLEMVMEDHKAAVKAFLDESLKHWTPFFLLTIKAALPPPPSKEEELKGNSVLEQWKGIIALKVQVIRTLEKVRVVFIQALTPHIVEMFQAVWEELSRSVVPYCDLFVYGDRQGKSVDADGLPYTLDALILEELDFLQIAFKAPPVKAQLEQQLKQAPGGAHSVSWLQELIKLLVSLAQIPHEEEELWQWDPNLYLCEATSITANYTPRTACAELAVRGLGEWLKQTPIDAMLFFCERNFAVTTTGWREREAILFLLNQLLRDVDDSSRKLAFSTTEGLLQQVSACVEDPNLFMRAGTHLVLSSLLKVSGEQFHLPSEMALRRAAQAVNLDKSDVVKVAAIRAMQDHLRVLPNAVSSPLQTELIQSLADFVVSHDLRDELEDAEDVKGALIETLRDCIMLDTKGMLQGPSINLFFTLASDGAQNFQLFQLLDESFEAIVRSVSAHGYDSYVSLCAKTIPSLTGAFDVANMTQESALTNLAAELVSSLAEYGLKPLPDGFVDAVMPKLNRILMEATDAELIQPATVAVQHMLGRGSAQFLQWTDSTGKSAVEATLTIINRLLNSPDVEEAAASEVGGLALELVNTAGAERLGPYLMELLRAVAVRLATAERAGFIQSLLMVFAGLSIAAPKEVVDFLSEVDINGQNGLNVVLAKWLENSISIAGFDEIRQNVVALSKLYSLEDPRIKQIGVKGDLVIENTSRIKTRSQAKLNPDKYTTIPANLKILKILVEELSSASTSKWNDPTAAAAAAALDSEGSSDGDDWEDVGTGGTLDLANGLTKAQLMGYAGEDDSPTSARARDDETADYLAQWFRAEAQKPGFQQMYDALNDEEKGKLQALV